MENKALKIETAEKGEANKVKTLYSYQKFRTELEIYNNVNDVFFDPKVQIRQDEGKYIFNINGKNKFALNTGYLQSRLKDFYDEKKIKEERKAEEEVHIRIEGLEITYQKSKTKEDLDKLQYEILGSQNTIENTTNIENIKFKVARLITFFENEMEFIDKKIGYLGGITNKKDEIPLWKIHKSQIEERLTQLKNIKQKVERLEQNKDKKYTIKRKTNGEVDVVYDDIQGFNMQTTLLRLHEKIEELGKEAPEFINTRNDILIDKGDTTPYYEIIINKETARILRDQIKNLNKEHLKTIEITLGADKRQALQQDLDRMQTYLKNYMNNPNEPLPPFNFEAREAFELLCTLDPNMKSLNQLNTKANKITDGEPNPEYAGYETTGTSKNTTGTSKNTTNNIGGTEYTASDYDSGKEAFEKGGINGFLNHQIDKTNMKPEQKQFWNGVGNIALTGGMIFVGYKMIQSAFRLLFKKEGYKDSKNRAWLLAPTALIFGAQARSGEGPLSLFKGGKLTEKFAGLFGRGGDKTAENDTEIPTESKVYTEGFIGLMGAFDMMTYGNMATYIEETANGKMKIKENQYDGFIAMLENGNDNQKAGAKFLKTHVGKEDKNGWMDMTLRSMGITSLKTLTDDPSKEFKETAAGAAARVYSVGAFMEKEENKFVKINPETMHLVNAYIANNDATIDDLKDLKKRGDVFETKESITDQTKLAPTIKIIAGTDTKKEREMINGINTFYDYRPTGDKSGLDIIGTGPVVEFKTYGYTTKINVDTKKIEGLNTEKFDSYAELFKAANLTNRLKYLCKDRTAVKERPFYIQSSDLMFDDAKVFSLNFDTEMVEEKSLKDISPTLYTYEAEYVNYLNNSTPKFRKEKA